MKQRLSYVAIFCLLGLLVGYVLADVGGWQIHRPPNAEWFSGSIGDPAWNWMKAVDKLVGAGGGLGTGSIYYVDSAVTTSSDGTSWERAVATIDAAVNLCTHDRGDYIMVAQGHSEAFITQSLDIDVRGVTLIGFGNGSLMPTIIYDHANAEVAIGADNVSIKGFRFKAAVTAVLMGIEVEDSVDYFVISDCVFDVNKPGTDEFAEAINFVNNNASCAILSNRFNMNAGGGHANAAIFCDADTADLRIIGNDIRGDYAVGCIGGDTAASTDILIMDNLLINGALVGDGGINAVAAVDMDSSLATGGLLINNYIASDVATAQAMHVFDDGVLFNNYVADEDGDEYSGSPEWMPYFVGADDANSIAGHVDG